MAPVSLSGREAAAETLPGNYALSTTGVSEGRPRWSHRCFRRLASMLLRVQCTGLDRLPASSKGVLLVANHISFLDGILICIFVPRSMLFCVTGDFALRYPAKAVFDLLGWLTGSRYIALDPERPFGMRKVFDVLKAGGTVMLFPEGKISDTGELQPLQPGLMRTIERTRAITVPVRIEGLATSIFGRAPAQKRSILPPVSIAVQGTIAANCASFHDEVWKALGGV